MRKNYKKKFIIKKIFILFLYLCFFNSNVNTQINQNITEEQHTKLNLSIKETIEKSKETLKNIENIKSKAKKAIDSYNEKKENEFKKTLAEIKDENTILFNIWGPINFYKKDIKRIGLFAFNLYIESLLFNKIKKEKINTIFNNIIKNSKNFEDILRKFEDILRKAKNDIKNKNNNNNLENLKNYIKNNHNYISNNPYKLSILPILFLNFFKPNILSFIRNMIFADKSNKKIFFSEEYHNSYIKSKTDKTLSRTKDFLNFSIVTLISLFPQLRYLKASLIDDSYKAEEIDNLFQKLIYNILQSLGLTNIGFINIKLPEFIFSKKLYNILYMLSLGYTVKLFDSSFNDDWLNYLLNKDDILNIITEYNKTDNLERKKTLENYLKISISNLFNNKSFLKTHNIWQNLKSSSNFKFLFITRLPMYIAIFHCYKWIIKDIFKSFNKRHI